MSQGGLSENRVCHRQMGASRKRRERPGLRKARVSSAADGDAGELADLTSLERVQQLQATRKKSKGITTEDSALGKELRRAGEREDGEDDPAADSDENRYGLQTFAAGDAATNKASNEEERMRKYVEDKLSKKDASKGDRPADEDERAKLQMATLTKTRPDEELNWSGGISEVPLTMDAKLKNIEQIEKAKRQIINQAVGLVDDDRANRLKRSDLPLSFGKK